MDFLKIKNLDVGYGEKKILERINFSMEKSEFIGLLGLNGTGKTTLLKTISGLIKPLGGKRLLNGQDISLLKEKERAQRISYMSQSNNIIYDIAVVDVVIMGITPYLSIFETPSKKHREMAYEMISLMGMEAVRNANFIKLSEGQKQLIMIARNLMQDAQLMLFDEPDSALDFVNKHMVLNKIREIVKKHKKGGIITLHDPNYALNYCDRIIILEDGNLYSDFTTKDAELDFLEDTFRKIYGDIELIKHKKKFILVR